MITVKNTISEAPMFQKVIDIDYNTACTEVGEGAFACHCDIVLASAFTSKNTVKRNYVRRI